MCSDKIENHFICKECFRELIAEKNLFTDVYKGQALCVTCRIKKEKRNATKAESIALLGEQGIDSVKR